VPDRWLTSGFDGFSKKSAVVCPDRVHHPTAIAYRPIERHRSSRARPVPHSTETDEGRKVKVIPRRQACPQVTAPLSTSEWRPLGTGRKLPNIDRHDLNRASHAWQNQNSTSDVTTIRFPHDPSRADIPNSNIPRTPFCAACPLPLRDGNRGDPLICDMAAMAARMPAIRVTMLAISEIAL
jgi:hypothetical protein